MKDVILSIRIMRVKGTISLSQSHYSEKVVKRFNESNSTHFTTPMDPNVYLVPSSVTPISQLEYASLIGSLMYTMTRTWADITFAIGKQSRFISNSSMFHRQPLRRMPRYWKKP